MKFKFRLYLSAICLAAPSCAVKPTVSASAPSKSVPIRRVVLVHGFMDTGSIFKKLRTRLEMGGCECYAPQLTPSDGRTGLENLAVQLKQCIDAKYGPEQKISIVAFSMGGLVTRHYLQNLGGASRCENLITISAPHHGSNLAHFYPGDGARDMRPGSRFLSEPQQSQAMLGKIPVTSYRTPLDLMILPATSSIWDRAENVKYPVLLHPLMLTSNRVITDIETRLAK